MDNNAYHKSAALIRDAFNQAAASYDKNAVLQQTVCDRLLESFEHINIKPVMILDLGAGSGYGSSKLKKRFRKAHIFQLDISETMLKIARQSAPGFTSRQHPFCADAPSLPLPDNTIDLVFCNLMLQWCNDLDRVFAEVNRVLKPGALFLFSSFGPDTLMELRQSWQQVDDEVHTNVFLDMHDVGDALVRQKLGEPVLNVERLVLTYDECIQLMRDIKNIGAHNINAGRRKTLTGKRRMQEMVRHYESFRADGKLPATYEVIYGHAWSVPSGQMQTATGETRVPLASMLDALKQKIPGKR